MGCLVFNDFPHSARRWPHRGRGFAVSNPAPRDGRNNSEIFQLEPIVAQQQPEFHSPGLRAGQIGKKGPGAAGFLFLTHGRCSSAYHSASMSPAVWVTTSNSTNRPALPGWRPWLFMARPGGTAIHCRSYPLPSQTVCRVLPIHP